MGNKQINDSLGDRMKDQYENRTRYMLPRRTYTIIRVDGKAFHTYARKMKRPYDTDFMDCMDAAAIALCDEFQGARLAFVQSDEISVLLADFDKPETCAAFDGNLQKLCSVSAATASVAFNAMAVNQRSAIVRDYPLTINISAAFDSRVFTIPDPVEIENYFIWRQKDAERNSVQMLAQHYASAKQLHGQGKADQHEIIHAHGDNWNDHPARFKRGRCIVYEIYKFNEGTADEAIRSRWVVVDAPIFVQDRDFLKSRIPGYEV